MRVDVALCQYVPVLGRPEENARTVMDSIENLDADVLLFPEMFLTGYGSPCSDMRETVEACIDGISEACRRSDKAVAIGSPRYDDDTMYNSLAFLSPDGDRWYDKAHLARFGVYAETGFEAGSSPAIGYYHGMGFGMCICYDVFFPEILHGCSLNGTSLNICAAASATQSKPFLDRILPARALEDVTYTAFINNVGDMDGLTMHGCSRGLDPFGETLASCGTSEGAVTFTVDDDVLEKARETRRHLSDFRSDVDWRIQRF